MTRAVFVLAALLALPHLLAAQQRGTIAIRGGTVITMAGPRISNGTVLIRDGKIAAVGTEVRIPADASIIDASRKYIMPGLIDAMTYHGIQPEDLNVEEPVTPELRILHGYYPFGRYGERAGPLRASELLSGGITTQYIAPGDAAVAGGQGAVVKTAATSYGDLIVRDPAALDIAIGERPARIFREQDRAPASRAAVMAMLRDALNDAQEYARDRDRASGSTGAGARQPPARDPRMEALLLLLDRRIPARIQANRPDDIRSAIALAEDFGFELIIDGGSSAHEMRHELAAKKVPVVLGPVSHSYAWTQDRADPEEFPEPEERSAAWLTGAGVKVAIASFARGHYGLAEAVTGKWLLLEAALALGYGLSEEDVLEAVTIHAAQILGVEDRVGSLEPGKDADLIILDGPPWSVLTWVEQVYVDGEIVHLRTNTGR